MTYLHHSFVRILLFLGLIIVGVTFVSGPLLTAFNHNIWLNSLILGPFFTGVALIFKQLFQLFKEQQWLSAYECGEEKFPGTPEPKILAPLKIFLDHDRSRNYNTVTLKSLLSSIEARLDESRDVNRYLTGLMVFLGLLGTFWGLSHTIGAITGVIGGIDMGSKDLKQAFDTLKQGLQSPLVGMGTAFSCSMFGLACSLILGFLDLTISKAGTTLFHSLEDKFSVLLKGGISDLLPSQNGSLTNSGPAYTSSLLEQATEEMVRVSQLIHRQEESRGGTVKLFQTVGEKLALLSEHMSVQQAVMQRMAQNQVDLQQQIINLTQTMATTHAKPIDDGIKEYLRNIDSTVLNVLEQIAEGRTLTVQELRSEIKMLARTISSLSEEGGQEQSRQT